MTDADHLDAYRPQGSALDLSIALTVADVAHEAGFGRTTFSVAGARPLDGAAPVAPELFSFGLRRVVDYFVAGMHSAYGLSNLAGATTFLLHLRRLADAFYDEMRTRQGAEAIVDTSPGNAELDLLLRALYPEVFGAGHVAGAAVPVAPPPAAAPVIVVGCPRSGTTWLQHMLQLHPALAGPDGETCFFTSVRKVLANSELIALVGRDRVVGAVRDFGAALFAHYQREHGHVGTRIVEKTPSNVDHLDAIATLYPAASIIGIYRDGRDVVASLMAMPFGPDDPVSASRGWARSISKLKEFAAKSEQIRVVRYEQVTADPVAEIVALVDWLGLAQDETFLERVEVRAAERVSQHQVRAIETLSGRAERDFYAVGGELLVELGYASAADLRAVRRRPAYALDKVKRAASRVVGR